MDSVLRNYFAGGRVRKTETYVFEIVAGVSAPQEGAGGMRGGDFRKNFYGLFKILINAIA